MPRRIFFNVLIASSSYFTQVDSGVHRLAEQTLSHVTHALDGSTSKAFYSHVSFLSFLANPGVWKSWDEKSPTWKSREGAGVTCQLNWRTGQTEPSNERFLWEAVSGEWRWNMLDPPHPLLPDAPHLLLLSLSLPSLWFLSYCQTYWLLGGLNSVNLSFSSLSFFTLWWSVSLYGTIKRSLCTSCSVFAGTFGHCGCLLVEGWTDVDVIWLIINWQTFQSAITLRCYLLSFIPNQFWTCVNDLIDSDTSIRIKWDSCPQTSAFTSSFLQTCLNKHMFRPLLLETEMEADTTFHWLPGLLRDNMLF